jgi:hypothetical protein
MTIPFFRELIIRYRLTYFDFLIIFFKEDNIQQLIGYSTSKDHHFEDHNNYSNDYFNTSTSAHLNL